MTENYKLNIIKDSRDSWSESLLEPFTRINPIYISTMEPNDIFKKRVLTIVANIIINLNSCDLDNLEFYMISEYSEEEIIIKNDFDSILKLLLENNLLIYQHATGKYWQRYYISLTKTPNKGGYYSEDEIQNYIYEMFYGT